MNIIENLLNELCSKGVAHKALGEVCKINKGKQLNKEMLTATGKYPAYNGGTDYSGFTDKYNAEADTVIISQGGASAGYVNFVTERFWANAHCYYCEPNEAVVLNRYLYHFLKQSQEVLMECKHGAGIPALSLNKITRLSIPLPPLPVQEEIVRILDTFTELIAELTAELTARKKQYEFYREDLLGFEGRDDVEWKKLGEVVQSIVTGKLNANARTEGGKYPFYTCDAFPYRIDTYAFDTEALLVSGNGSQVGHINYYKGKFNAYQRTYVLSQFEGISVFYIHHYLKYRLKEYINLNARQGSVPYITMPMLQNFKLPIPSLAEQERIVSILDQFDTLTNSLTEGIPAEIALRQKQYEFYREKLLTF